MAGTSGSIATAGSYENPRLLAVEDVEIDKSGKFKYILLKVHDREKDAEFKYIVRGLGTVEYHADIYDVFVPNIESRGLDCECVGGGRIHHEPSEKTITIYGYSQGYGQADHSITHSIIQGKFGSKYDVKWNNDGY